MMSRTAAARPVTRQMPLVHFTVDKYNTPVCSRNVSFGSTNDDGERMVLLATI
jgi:hypothetical protein